MLNNIKTYQTSKGFTIVELLIVIVVIAILAAISIVAYNGIQQRGRASAAQSSGNIVVKKAEAANSLVSAYPTAVADFSANQESSLSGSGITLVSTFTPTATNGTSQVLYQKCTTPAASRPAQQARVQWYNYQAGAASNFVYLGGAVDADCTTWGAALTGGPY